MRSSIQAQRFIRSFSFLTLGILCGNVEASSTVIYDLGTLGGTLSAARDVNSSGDVVGISEDAGGNQRAFLYDFSSGTMSDLGTIGRSQANAINDSGVIVGFMTDATGLKGFKYSAGVVTSIGTLGGNTSSAGDINASGDIAGSAATATATRAVLFSGGTLSNIGILGVPASGSAVSGASSINASGAMVGSSATSTSSVFHAFLYSGGVMTDLGTLGGPSSSAYKINDSGQIVGESTLNPPGSGGHAFLFSGGVMNDLGTLGGTLSRATDINSAGEVVGLSSTTAGAVHAFFYTSGSMLDLNDFLPPGSPWVLTNAAAINDNGQIVGHGTINGEVHAFLMEPGC